MDAPPKRIQVIVDKKKMLTGFVKYLGFNVAWSWCVHIFLLSRVSDSVFDMFLGDHEFTYRWKVSSIIAWVLECFFLSAMFPRRKWSVWRTQKVTPKKFLLKNSNFKFPVQNSLPNLPPKNKIATKNCYIFFQMKFNLLVIYRQHVDLKASP